MIVAPASKTAAAASACSSAVTGTAGFSLFWCPPVTTALMITGGIPS